MTPTTQTSSAPATTAHKSEEVSRRLLQLRDELIVRNHLAGMELKGAVHELAREVERLAASFGRRLEGAGALPHEAKVRMYLGYLDADARLLEMEAALKTALAGAAHSAVALAETARVRAALARMDADDAVQKSQREIVNELHVLEARGNKVLDDIGARLTKLGIATNKII